MTRLFLDPADPTKTKLQIKEKLPDFLKEASLQAIFIYGDCLDVDSFKDFRAICKEKEIFLSIVHFNEETGSVIAVNDYNAFAQEILSKGNLNQMRPNQNRFNLFFKIQKNTKTNWKHAAKNLQKDEEALENEPILLNAAKSLYIAQTKRHGTLALKDPLYPTIFNGFFKESDKEKYMNCYFYPK